MKITRNHGPGSKLISIPEAVFDKLTPDAYSYDGELEKMKRRLELQSEMIAGLVETLATKLILHGNDIDRLLGYGYTVED